MRKLLVFVIFFCSIVVAKSQNLTVEGTAPNLYITHIVAPKEGIYSIGRLYNQAPKAIASFNGIAIDKGLSIGQKLKVPLNSANFSSDNAGSDASLIPVTHIVEKSETLFRIGNNHNVSPEMIRKWNNLSSDNISAGTPLIVGHLKVSGGQSLPAVSNTNTRAGNPPASTPAAERAVAVSEPRQAAAQPRKENSYSNVGAEQNNTPAPSSQPGYTSNGSLSASSARENSVSQPPAQKNNVYTTTTALSNTPEGAFAGTFSKGGSLKNKRGEAATFKSTSGWQDKKFYVLMDDVAPGTILKIASGDKVVYAKVLGNMPEMKENNGLLLRISNSAASSLGIIDPKFPVEVSYYQ